MTAMPADEEGTWSRLPAYQSSWEHLADELKRLDLRIQRQLLRQRTSQPAGPLDQFKGLILSESEISALLTPALPTVDYLRLSSCNAEYQALEAALEQMGKEIAERRAASLEEGIYLSLPHLARVFELTTFEQDCLIICLAPELDRKYEKLYAYLQDDVTRKKPSASLVLELLLETPEARLAARSVFEPHTPLLRFRILQKIDNPADLPTPLLSRFIKLDDRMVNFLLGAGRIDARLEPVARLALPEAQPGLHTVSGGEPEQVLGFLRAHMCNPQAAGEKVLVYLYGPYGSGKETFATAVSRDLGFYLLLVDVAQMIDETRKFEETAWLLGREALLQPALLCFENFDSLMTDDLSSRAKVDLLLKVISDCCRVTFLSGSESWKPRRPLDETVFIDLRFRLPDDSTRKRYWQELSSERFPLADNIDLGALAGKFNFTQGQIEDALMAAQTRARLRSNGNIRITLADIEAACRAQSHHQLGTLARRIEPVYGWRDLVLPPDALGQLEELCARVAERQRVLGEWGFGRKLSLGKGVNALFAGPSGTGKTLAAEIIAKELGLELYKIDLSGIISKYIGETEKNLDRVFTTAENANAILFFDEADALFGKRSEVRDSHDRYANIEISYLLQKMEQYEGVAILATNLRQNLDDAFLRRLQFIVEFPFPDESHRRRIWEVLFPPEAPRDEAIDFDLLARQFRLAGGNIKNIVLASAYLAASDDGCISMSHLSQAALREYQKLGKVFTEAELKGSAN